MTGEDDPYLKLSSAFDSICVICKTEINGNKSKLQDNSWNNFGIILKTGKTMAGNNDSKW